MVFQPLRGGTWVRGGMLAAPVAGPEGLLCGEFTEDGHHVTGKSWVRTHPFKLLSQQLISVGGEGEGEGGAAEAIKLRKPF